MDDHLVYALARRPGADARRSLDRSCDPVGAAARRPTLPLAELRVVGHGRAPSERGCRGGRRRLQAQQTRPGCSHGDGHPGAPPPAPGALLRALPGGDGHDGAAGRRHRHPGGRGTERPPRGGAASPGASPRPGGDLGPQQERCPALAGLCCPTPPPCSWSGPEAWIGPGRPRLGQRLRLPARRLSRARGAPGTGRAEVHDPGGRGRLRGVGGGDRVRSVPGVDTASASPSSTWCRTWSTTGSGLAGAGRRGSTTCRATGSTSRSLAGLQEKYPDVDVQTRLERGNPGLSCSRCRRTAG